MNNPESTTKCPECFEPVNPQATKCPHCTADIYFCPHCESQVTIYIEYHRTSGWSWDESAMGYCTKCRNKIVGPEKSMCFIATAAYGTALAPDIDTLRYVRDNHLSNYTLGRAFIKAYEFLSPPIAKFISGKVVLQWIVRLGLKPIVYICKQWHKE